MNIIDLYNKQNIEGFSLNDIERILKNEHESIKIKKLTYVNILLSNNKLLKCVNNYFYNPNDLSKKHRCLEIKKIRYKRHECKM